MMAHPPLLLADGITMYSRGMIKMEPLQELVLTKLAGRVGMDGKVRLAKSLNI